MVEMLNLVEKTTGVQVFLILLPVVQPPMAVKSLFCFYFFLIGNWQLFHGESYQYQQYISWSAHFEVFLQLRQECLVMAPDLAQSDPASLQAVLV